jgi:hypothetical protein
VVLVMDSGSSCGSRNGWWKFVWFDKLMVELLILQAYVRLFYMSVCIIVASCFICILIFPWHMMSLHSYTLV